MEKFNMIDEKVYESQIKDIIGSERLIPIEKYQESILHSQNKIAIIYAEGNILLDGERGGIGNSITPGKINSEIDKALKNPNIKGIVLRLNSPGGSALASNLIHHKLQEANKIKPIYVSIGGVAASGGYYMASAGQKIFADNESITGSIGVVSLIPNFNELMKKIDVNVESVKKGEYSDLFSLTKDFNEKDREKIYASSVKVYNEFLDVVAQGRNLNREYVHSIAQGKVWLGEEGKEIDLVDEIGGIENAISSLAKELKIDSYEVVEIVEKEKLDVMLKQYIPFKTFWKNLSLLEEEKELFFEPIYF
jgi:protease IV